MPANSASKPGDDRRSRGWSALDIRSLGYKSFVAWRYLLVTSPKVTRRTGWLVVAGIGLFALLAALRTAELSSDRPWWSDPLLDAELATAGYVFVVLLLGVLRHSKVALLAYLIGIGLAIPAVLISELVKRSALPFVVDLSPDHQTALLQALSVIAIVGLGLSFLAMFFGCLRAFFTFFTTVPIGGVWIGTSALVLVLAVMSGFESDLREKIVGSNAHLQIAREDGDFVEWREIKAAIDRMPGVVASTPFAVSEVVVAAHNQGMSVIIKGIDPSTVGKVTDLVSDLKDDPDAIKRLAPIADDSHDRVVPQHPRTGKMIDPPPDDLPSPGEPIDFSGSEPPSAKRPAPATKRSGPDAARPTRHAQPGGALEPAEPPEPPEPRGALEPTGSHDAPGPYGGDAHALLGDLDADPAGSTAAGRTGSGAAAQSSGPVLHPAKPIPAPIDPPPADLVTTDEPPADYSQPDYAPDSVVKVIDIPFEPSFGSRRTQALPGVLVGKELAKQTNLHAGEEVRVVSPLSDPSNPDATGTPIPFSRDYRVAGTFFTGMYEYDLKYVYVTLDSLQDFLDRGDAVDGIEVRVTNPDDSDAFVARFQAAFGPRYRVQDWKELNRSLFSALKLEKIAMFLVLGIVIMVASFSIVGNLIMVVVEKAREIALLKTLGASDVGVMQLFAIQGLMIGLIGTALGVATGLVGCWGIRRFGFPLNPDVYYIDRMPIHVDPSSVLAAASAGILISIAATLYPAVVAARVRPAAGMRH
jgi:lipoprotein-releasing system permease protein